MDYTELLKRLDLLSDKLGQGADHFWPLAIRQVYIDFYLWLGVFTIYTLIWGVTMWLVKRDDDSNALGGGVLLVGGGLWVMLCIILVALTSEVLNPEYEALKTLLRTIK